MSTCRTCDIPISRHARSGYCQPCYDKARRAGPREIPGTRVVEVMFHPVNSGATASTHVRLKAEPWA